jgi:hypothetical protein
MGITFDDMAEALYQLRKRNGLYYNPSEQEILREAINSKTSDKSDSAKAEEHNKDYEVNKK